MLKCYEPKALSQIVPESYKQAFAVTIHPIQQSTPTYQNNRSIHFEIVMLVRIFIVTTPIYDQ